MIGVPQQFFFLATPRTGSRAIASALLKEYEHAVEIAPHHVHPLDVLDYNVDKFPMYTVMRNPYEQTLSWYYHIVLRHNQEEATEDNFAKFICTKSCSWFFYDTLNPYSEIATRTFCYEDGLEDILYGMTGKKIEVERIGVSKNKGKGLLTPRTKGLIRERFPKDVELYTGRD